MLTGLLNKLWLKSFNKEKYLNLKNQKSLKNKIKFYNDNIIGKLSKIENSLIKNKELSFSHSGHLGDLIYSLPLVKELAKKYICKFYVKINKKIDNYDKNHPSGNVMINDRAGKLVLPLLQNQNYISSAEIYKDEKIDIDLDIFREIPININFHSVRWYMHLTGTHFDMSQQYLDVDPHESVKNKIVIMRSPRYRNSYINYSFLKNIDNIVCVGLLSEYEDLKKDIPNLEFYDCKDFLELAAIIKSSKFFIGNLCFAYSIAEGLKIPRLLEASPDFPVVFPTGKKGYDFYHQIHFEKLFKSLLIS